MSTFVAENVPSTNVSSLRKGHTQDDVTFRVCPCGGRLGGNITVSVSYGRLGIGRILPSHGYCVVTVESILTKGVEEAVVVAGISVYRILVAVSIAVGNVKASNVTTGIYVITTLGNVTGIHPNVLPRKVGRVKEAIPNGPTVYLENVGPMPVDGLSTGVVYLPVIVDGGPVGTHRDKKGQDTPTAMSTNTSNVRRKGGVKATP